MKNIKQPGRRLFRNPLSMLAMLFVPPIVIIISSFFDHASAGTVMGNGGATEVTQLMNNLELAQQTMTSNMQSLTNAKQLYYDQLQNAAKTVSPAWLEKTMNAAGGYEAQIAAMKGLIGSSENFKQVLAARQNQFSASGLNWEQYVQREKDRAATDKSRASILTTAELKAAESVQDNWDIVRQHQSQLVETVGVHDSTRVLNGQMNTLLSMTNQSINNSNVHYQAQTSRAVLDDADRERATTTRNDAWQRQKAINARNAQRLGLK